MAEKYGTIPPKFTKQWWEYFWMYYKMHVIALVFVIICAVVTVYQIASRPKYDITLLYAGEDVFSSKAEEEITESLSPLCIDVDKNGKTALFFSQLNFTPENDPEYAMAMNTKLTVTLGEGETYLFIMDKALTELYIGETEKDSAFAPIKDWYRGNKTKDLLSVHDIAYGIALSECELFKGIDADLSDKYLFLRYYPRKDQIKKQLDGYHAAQKLANQIIDG